MRRLRTFFTKALRNIGESPLENSITIAVIAISLAILGIYMLFLINANAAMEKWRGDMAVILYLDVDITQQQQAFLIQKAQAVPEVMSVMFVSNDSALENFMEDVPGYKNLFDMLGGNPLPSSLELKLVKPSRNVASVERVAELFVGEGGVEDVYFGKDWIVALGRLVRLTYTLGGAVGLFLLIGAVFIIYHTINLTILNRKSEIEVQRLVGASRRFIYAPFLVEGMLQGLVGALASLVFLHVGYRMVINMFGAETGVLFGAVRWQFLPASFMLGLLCGGMSLGIVGSAFSISRYTKI